MQQKRVRANTSWPTDLTAQMAASLGSSVYLTWLAEAQAKAGNLADALETIEKALIANPESLPIDQKAFAVEANCVF
jgi:hypothetical protein